MLSLPLNGLEALKVNKNIEAQTQNAKGRVTDSALLLFVGVDNYMKCIKRKIIKNILVGTLALVLAVSAPFSGVMKVKATAALPATAESAESLMALLDVLVNAMAAGGAIEYVADYDNDMDLLDGFMKFARSMSLAGNPPGEMEFVLADGTTTTLDDLLTDVEDGVITLPNEQQWGQYRVGFGDDFAKILEAWEERGSGTGGSSEPEPEEPKFNKLKALAIGSGLVGSISAFILALKNGEVEGLAPETYFEADQLMKFTEDDYHAQLSGTYTASFRYSCSYSYFDSSNNRTNNVHVSRWFDQSVSKRMAAYHHISNDGSHSLGFVQPSGNSWAYVNYPGFYTETFNGKVSSGSFSGNTRWEGWYLHNTYTNCSCSGNFPIFSSAAEAGNYVTSGQGYKNAINYKPSIYNYPSLANSLSNSLASWTGTRLSPATLQKTYTGVKNAYETEIKPNVDTEKDTDTNTKTYVDTVTKVVTETIVKPDTDTSTEPGTETKPGTGTTTPGTGTGTGTGTDTDLEVDVNDYKVDLREVFPFCIPFDFITLLNVLDADPVAPCFSFPVVIPALDYEESVQLDMAIFDDVAKVIRTCEKVSFLIFLMFATSKVIRW